MAVWLINNIANNTIFIMDSAMTMFTPSIKVARIEIRYFYSKPSNFKSPIIVIYAVNTNM